MIAQMQLTRTHFPQMLWSRMKPHENLFLSPFSVRSALTRAAVGARGNTREQMNAVLGIAGMSDNAIVNWLANLEGSIKEQHDVVLAIANRIYAQRSYPFDREYLRLMSTVAIQLVDFRAFAEEVRGEINAWVTKETYGRILNLLPEGSVDADTRMVIANAIFFKGSWRSKFDKRQTRDDKFYLDAGRSRSVTVPMMHQKHKFLYYEDNVMQAVELPYVGNRFSMIILLPGPTGTLVEVEELLRDNLEMVLQKMSRSQSQNVNLSLPRFQMSWGTEDLTQVLGALGIRDAFDADLADFSGMARTHELFIGGVYHQAFVKVDEEGSEAAAATAVVMTRESMVVEEEVIMRVDHPFCFLIVDQQNGEVLFMGRVLDPTK